MSYTPRPGTIADQCMQALAGGPLTVADLCNAIGRDYNGIHADLRIPLRHGAIVKTAVGGRAGFRLGDGWVPADHANRFAAALWSDGTMAMMNVRTTAGERAAVELTSAQVEMVRRLLAGGAA